jgi:hypothetical protein
MKMGCSKEITGNQQEKEGEVQAFSSLYPQNLGINLCENWGIV